MMRLSQNKTSRVVPVVSVICLKTNFLSISFTVSASSFIFIRFYSFVFAFYYVFFIESGVYCTGIFGLLGDFTVLVDEMNAENIYEDDAFVELTRG